MWQFLKQWLYRPLRAAALRLRRTALRLVRRPRGRWLAGEHSDPKGLLFYAPMLAPKRAYRLYLPANYVGQTGLPMLVMLHGCKQDPMSFAAGTRMNQLADREGFLVLYPEQRQAANAYGCWNWFDPSAKDGGGEALLIAGMVREVVAAHGVDAERIYVAGLSAGGAMTSILASCHGDLFAACAVHSGLMFRAATSLNDAGRAMKQGSRTTPKDAAKEALRLAKSNNGPMPAMVIQGSADETVSPVNAEQIIEQFTWMTDQPGDAESGDVTGIRETMISKGVAGGYVYDVHDYLHDDRLLLRKIIVEGMGHAWSGGDGRYPFNDPKGPDASRMIWEFVSRFRQRGAAQAVPEGASPEQMFL